MFFSGTDSSTLHEASESFVYLLSVIVNNNMDITGKVAMHVKEEMVIKTNFRKSDGSSYNFNQNVNNKCVYVWDCNISKESIEIEDELFISQVEEICKPKTTPYYSNWNNNGFNNNDGQTSFWRNHDSGLASNSVYRSSTLNFFPYEKNESIAKIMLLSLNNAKGMNIYTTEKLVDLAESIEKELLSINLSEDAYEEKIYVFLDENLEGLMHNFKIQKDLKIEFLSEIITYIQSNTMLSSIKILENLSNYLLNYSVFADGNENEVEVADSKSTKSKNVRNKNKSKSFKFGKK